MEIHPVDGYSTRGWLDVPPFAPKWLDGNPTILEPKPGLKFQEVYDPTMQSSQNGVYLGGVGVKLPLLFSF